MLITAFAKHVGLSVDTVRFYVRRGLLTPSTGMQGVRHPYMLFSEAETETAVVIQTCQSLGLTLNEIKAFLKDFDRYSNKDLVAYLRRQQARLHEKAAELNGLTHFLEAKIAWIEGGKVGVMPEMKAFTVTKSSTQ